MDLRLSSDIEVLANHPIGLLRIAFFIRRISKSLLIDGESILLASHKRLL
jgi:hypothetical protein